jgi:DNA ligase-1
LLYSQNQSGAGSKGRIQASFAKLDDLGWELVYRALNPYIMYNVKKYDWPTHFRVVDSDHKILFDLLDKLNSRELTGNAARAAVTATLGEFTVETATAIKHILMKDFKAGISAETLNELHFGKKIPLDGATPITHLSAQCKHIPIYACMLAEKMPKKTDKKQFNWARKLIIDSKLDGTRNNASVRPTIKEVVHRARSGKPSDHLDGLFDDELLALAEALNKIFDYPENTEWMIDGEAKGSTFQATMNAKSSKNDGAKQALDLYVYDIVPLENWKTHTTWEIPQLERLKRIEDALDIIQAVKLKKTEWVVVESYDDALAHYTKLVDDGYEGAVVKTLDNFYEWDRSEGWVKWKPVETFDGYITGFYQGKPDTDIADVLGGVYIEGVDENGDAFECKVGSGFTKLDEEGKPSRTTIWNNQELYLGKCIEIEADPTVSKKDDRDINSLRWGVFIKMRPDKDKA